MGLRQPSRRALEALVAELNTAAEASTIDFAFATPSTERNIVKRQLSLLFGDRDWLTHDRVGTEVSVRASVARALLDPKFQWSEIEQEIGLAYPARAFRAHVIDAVERCVRLELAGPLRSPNELRKQWSDIVEEAARAGVQIAKIREKLARLPGWSREVASQIVEPAETRLDALAWFAQCLCDEIPTNKESGGRPPMFEFYFLVNVLAQIFAGTTGRKPAVNRNAITSEYYGPFLVMMDAVLARLRHILHELGRPPIAEPVTAQARGKFIVRVLAKDRNQNLILQALALHARRAPGTLPAD